MQTHPETRFILNQSDVTASEPLGLLVLDYLRRRRRLVGTKEGCKEGDCGACVVLIGELIDGRLEYNPVTSCLLPLGELHGKHLATIEGINCPGRLSPLQQAVVDEGGSQCGYCTPGIIISMTCCVMNRRAGLEAADVKRALSGHLCRCTGYASLLRAGERMERLWGDEPAESPEYDDFEGHIDRLIEMKMLPDYFSAIPDRLRALQARLESSPLPDPASIPETRVAGGTDLYVQRGEEIPDGDVAVLNRGPTLDTIRRRDGILEVGALITFEALSHDPAFQQLVPDIEAFMFLIASLQVRNRATLAGNVINASPIGDMTILLLALEAEIRLSGVEGERTLPLRDLYRGYKQLDMSRNEILTHFLLPIPPLKTHVNFEKVSKRTCLDIATVNSAVRLSVDGDIIRGCNLAVGGVAPIPKHLPEAGLSLIGKSVTPQTVRALLPLVQQEITPISDVRGSADYKRLLSRQLVIAHFVKLFPDKIRPDEFVY